MKIVNLITHSLRNLGRSLVVDKSELQIEQKHDRHGNSYWQVYDFTTNKFYFFGSEQEVRVWIDDRYHSAYKH